MPDIYEATKRSLVMSRVQSKGTAPELRVRDALAQRGLEYQVNVAALPGKPDIVLPAIQTALLVHGCWWHRHDCPKGSRQSSTRAEFWREKIAKNVERDRRDRARLEEAGWRVAIIWECETTRGRLETCLNKALA